VPTGQQCEDEGTEGRGMPGSAAAAAGDRHAVEHEAAGSGQHRSSALGRYHTGLDGLRGMAMLVVLLYHAGVRGVPGAFLGLSQFFTLSGFLVAAMLLRAHDGGGIALRPFWIRRVRRLAPASIVALAGIAAFGMFVATPAQAETIPTHLAAAALWVANWYSILADQSYVDLFAAPSPLDHFWSLSLEEQFYLFMSFGMAFLLRRTARTGIIVALLGGLTVASLGWATYLSRSGAPLDRVYLGTDTRLSEILLGSILAVLLVRGVLRPGPAAQRILGWSAAVAYLGALWLWHVVPIDSEAMWGSGGNVAYAAMTVLVILGILSDRGPLAVVLAWWPIAAFGRISYGVYLYHWPIFLWLTAERTGLDGAPLLALRLGTTLVAAVASYHLLEIPIRNGATLNLSRRARYLAMPVCTCAVILAAVLVVPGGGTDDSITFQDDGSAHAPPVAETDPVLDVLVVADAAAGPVVDHLVAVGEHEEDVEVVDGGTFACTSIEHTDGAWRCPEWEERWGSLIDEHDPDSVVLFVEDWATTDLESLVASAGGADEPLEEVAQQVLAGGFDHLTGAGAPITWAVGAAPVSQLETRPSLPFHRAMNRLLLQRSDLVQSPFLPLRRRAVDEAYLDQVSTTLLGALEVNRRRSDDGVTRVMVVGDSSAKSVGFGLERDAAEEGYALVWNVAAAGCGIVQDGVARDFRAGGELQPDPNCVEARELWAANVAEFDPDVVLVLSGLRDAQQRDLDGDGTFATPGDPELDQHLVDSYVDAVDVLSADGATVVWLAPPCVRFVEVLVQEDVDEAIFHPDRMAVLRAIADRVQEARPDVVEVYDLDAVLCPDGEFLESVDGVGEIRPDGIHLSVAGSLWLAEQLHRDLLAEPR
jgi:peptidoglycan/LPS O-acetylase OafA/YrhL